MVSSKSHCISFLPSIVEPLYNFKYSIWKLLDVHFTGVWERCMVFAYAYVCKFKNYLVCSQNLKKKMFFRKFFQQMFQFYWVRQIFICIQSTSILACTLSTALALSHSLDMWYNYYCRSSIVFDCVYRLNVKFMQNNNQIESKKSVYIYN